MEEMAMNCTGERGIGNDANTVFVYEILKDKN